MIPDLQEDTRNLSLRDAARGRNSIESYIRAYLEHHFGCMGMTIDGKLKERLSEDDRGLMESQESDSQAPSLSPALLHVRLVS